MNNQKDVRQFTGRNWAVAAAIAILASLAGCNEVKTDEHRWFAPDEMVAPPSRPAISMIRSSISVADERQELIPNAVSPTEDDYTYSDRDYVFGPTDVIGITITGLMQPDVPETLQKEVSDTGYIDLPFLPERIKAEGLTQEELKQKIIDAYSPNILRNPQVQVAILARRQNTFSILGAVMRVGTYSILRKDMRLLEALALAGDVTQSPIDYIYVIRMAPPARVGGEGPKVTPGRIEELGPLPEEVPPGVAPAAPAAPKPAAPAPPASAPGGTDAELQDMNRLVPGKPASNPSTPANTNTLPAPMALTMLAETDSHAAAPASAESPEELQPANKNYKWVYTNGRWIRVEQEGAGAKPAENPPVVAPAAPAPSAPQPPSAQPQPAPQAPPLAGPAQSQPGEVNDPFGWKKIEKANLARVIAINFRTLKNGDPRMNIIVRDNDVIQVPTQEAGEFYLMGEVVRPGVYSLTGRLITVKMAVAAAGNLTQLSWPENSILIRRVGHNQEQVIPLNIEAIFKGEASDLFLKPDDLLAVGTDWRTPFLAVLRNAFRLSYGFGFVYDRNFYDVSPGETRLNSKRFTRW